VTSIRLEHGEVLASIRDIEAELWVDSCRITIPVPTLGGFVAAEFSVCAECQNGHERHLVASTQTEVTNALAIARMTKGGWR